MTPTEAEARIQALTALLAEQAATAQVCTALVESSEDAIVTTDLDGRVTGWNPAAERIFGYRADEMLGRSIELLMPEERRAEARAHLARIAHGERVDHFDTVRRRSDGSSVEVSSSASPIRGAIIPGTEPRPGPIVGAATISRNIGDRKRVERELAEHRHQLERSNAALEEFAYAASHDLQEPLRMVASYLELLAQRYRGKLDEKADKYIHYAVDGAKRMQQLVDDLLAYSRVGSQRAPFGAEPCDAVIQAVCDDLERAIADSGAVVEAGPLPVVLGDGVRLRQLFQNLIGNALKFRGAAPPRIAIAARRDGERWTFSVADNGIGLDPAYADKIFRMFQRLHARGTYEGSGIGLALARRIVELHGGRIWVESRPGEGATFYFTLQGAP